MKVRVTKDNKSERRVLIAMIMNDRVLSDVADKWSEPGLFGNKWSNLVGGWAVRYFHKYGRAPRDHIQPAFERWADKSGDEDTIGLVSKFLGSLSKEYTSNPKQINSQAVIDEAGELFNEVRIQNLVRALQAQLDASNISEATNLLTQHQTIEMGVGAGVDVLQDENAVRAAFEDKAEPIIKYPGALGMFFGDALERDGFIAFMGAEKRGKTWWLLEVAWRAMMQGRRVAFFSVGDMSQNQVIRRWSIRAAKHPIKPKTIRIPRLIEPPDDDGIAIVTHDEQEIQEALNWKRAWGHLQRYAKKRGDCLKLSTHPNSSLTVTALNGILQQWEVEKDWRADVVVIDYADILAPENGRDDSREATNKTWKKLRGLSQERHCLVVTATQADASSYTAATLSRANFSEDKRKYAHVTGMIGLNATNSEKSEGITRLNWLVLREAEFSEETCVHVAGCLDIGQPAIESTF